MRPPRRQQRMVRAVVYLLVLLVVVGMILTMVGSALAAAAPAGPAGPEPHTSVAASSPMSPSGSRGSSGATLFDQSPHPAPVVLLGTHNLTWTDLQRQASRTTTGNDVGAGDVGEAAARLLSFASANEPINLSVRTPTDRTCPADGWLTLGRGARASAVEPAESCTRSTGSATPGSVSPLARTLEQGGASVVAVGPGARLATGSPDGSSGTPAFTEPSASSLREALSAGADLTIVDTAESVSSEAERIDALDEALRTTQEQVRPGTRIVIASLADDEDPGPQMMVLPSGTTSTRGTEDGLVVGTSTHRPGLAQLTDLTPTFTTALVGHDDPTFDGQALSPPPTGTATVTATTAPDDSRIARLADDALHARASQLAVLATGVLLIGSAAMLLVWAAVVLRAPDTSRRPTAHRRVTWVAICLGALPTALLLVNAIPWWRAGAREGTASAWAPTTAVVAATVVAACIVGLAAGIVTLVSWLRTASSAPTPSWPASMYSAQAGAAAAESVRSAGSAGSAGPTPFMGAPNAAPQRDDADDSVLCTPPPSSRAGLVALMVAATIPLSWLTDAAAGAHLAFNNPLGMNAVVAGRFYGVSNTAFALVAGALVVVIAGTWERLGRSRRTALVLTCLLGGVALIIDGAPQLGADVGGALTLVPTLALLGSGLAGLRLSRWRWLVIVATTVMVVAGFAAVDLIRPGGPTHLGRFARQVSDGSAAGVLGRKAYALFGPFVTRPGAAAGLVCLLILVAAGLWWLRRQVRAWRAGTSPYAWLAATYDGDTPRAGGRDFGPPRHNTPPSVRWEATALRTLVLLTLVSILVNDSGVTMAGFILAAAAPALLALALIGSDSPQLAGASHLDPTQR